MKKRMKFDKTIAPVFVLNQTEWDQSQPFIRAFIQTQSLVQRFRDSRRHQHLRLRYRAAFKAVNQTADELQEEGGDFAWRMIGRMIVETAREQSLDPRRLLYFFLDILNPVLSDKKKLRIRVRNVLSCIRDDNQKEFDSMGPRIRKAVESRITTLRIHDKYVSARPMDCLEPAAKIFRDASDDLLPLLLRCSTASEVFEEVSSGNTSSGLLSDESIIKQEAYVNAIHEASERAKQAFNALKDKFEMQKTHALAALDGCAAFPGGGSLVVALCVSQLLNYGDLFEPWVIDWDTNILETLPDMTEMPSFIAADPLFWYIVITQLLHNRGAFDGSAVRSWVPQLLANAILHPKRVGRMPVPREADRARAALAKHIAPMLVGFHSFDDDAKAVFNGTLSSEQILALFAGHLANVIDSSDPTQPCFRNKAHRKAFNFFWLNLVGPNREEIMQWLASSSQFVSLPDESSKDDPVEAIQTPSGDGELDAELVAQESDETPPIHCFYVTNPAASELQLIEAPIPTDAGDASDFAKFLRAQGVSKAVKAISIAHALEFFRTMPEMSRTLRPHETVGCQTWHKLKRGRIRIYVRMESDERILFHVYQRKDWKPNGLAA